VTALKHLVPGPLRPVAKRAYHRLTPPARRRAGLAASFRAQAGWCRRLGSPLYTTLLNAVASDITEQGLFWRLLADRPPTSPGADEGIPLRLMAGMHRAVLEGKAPELADYYPSAGGAAGEGAWLAFVHAAEAHQEDLRDALDRPVQTNEVRRCCALLGGFLLVAADTGLPLRLLEVGASAGLNLRWPEYYYESGGRSWGDPESPVRFRSAFADGGPPSDADARIASRKGCDLAPLDPSKEEDRLALLSLVWADDLRRLEDLRAALEVARRVPVLVDRALAEDWIEEELRAPVPGAASVVFHSFVMQYLDEAGRARFQRLLEEAGRRATSSAPLAWLRMEWGKQEADVLLTSWPGGTTRLVAKSDNQGRRVEWLGG
jgi:hypothetical protein